MTMEYFLTSCENMKKEMRVSRDCGNVNTQNGDGNATSLGGFVQIVSDKTAAILKGTALVAYAVQAILLNVSPRRRKR